MKLIYNETSEGLFAFGCKTKATEASLKFDDPAIVPILSLLLIGYKYEFKGFQILSFRVGNGINAHYRSLFGFGIEDGEFVANLFFMKLK